MPHEVLLSYLKASNLNYSLQESPFSAQIEIKKSFITEKDGTVRSSGIFYNSKILLDENKSLGMALAKQCYDHQDLLKTNWELRMELEKVKAEGFVNMSAKEALEELHRKEAEIVELKSTLEYFETEVKTANSEMKKLKNENKELLSKFENSRLEVKNLKLEIGALKSEKNSLSIACKTSRKEIKELNKKFDKEKEQLELKIVDLNTFKLKIKAKEREEILQSRKALKRSKKEAKIKATKESLKHDTIDETNGNIIVNVVTNNRFETLLEVDDSNEDQAQHNPESSLECESSGQKYSIMSGASSSTPSTAVTTSSVVNSSSNTSSSRTFQERIQCDLCLRKCVDEKHMEHHIFLWHTDTKTQNLMSTKKLATFDS